MRNTFINTLMDLAERDKDIYLLTGDLGFSFLERFAERFPDRFINCGVAEQNMIGVAAGLALEKKKAYVYSIVPFVTMRCFEQIRNDVCYQNLNVKIIGIGGGFSYGYLGATHYAIEDIAILRSLPNMMIISPADPIETKQLLLKLYKSEGPAYIRLGRGGEKELYESSPQLEIGKPSVVKNGKDRVLLANGVQVATCLEVAEKMEKIGYKFKVISMPTLKPIKGKELLKEIEGAKQIFTVEEHNIIGGLGSAIAEILAESDWKGEFKRIAIPDEYPQQIGSAEYLRKKYQINAEKIISYLKRKYDL